MRDEPYSFDELSDELKKKEPAEVKRLISEGSIKVFRDADQVRLKPVSKDKKERRKARKRLLRTMEQQYYNAWCCKFRQENWMLMGVTALLGSVILAVFLPSSNRQSWPFIVVIAAICSLLAAITTLALANSALARFLVLSEQKTLLKDKKHLLPFFVIGYSCTHIGKHLWHLAIAFVVLLLIVHLNNYHAFVAIGYIIVVAFAIVGAYVYHRRIVQSAVYKMPVTSLPIIEEPTEPAEPIVDEMTEVAGRELDIDEPLLLSASIAVLQNKTPKVRKKVIRALGSLGSAEAITTLITTLGDPSEQVRAETVKVLGNIEEKSIREPIKCLLYDESAEVRAAVVAALAKLRDKDTLSILTHALEDKAAEVRESAAEALGTIGNKKTVAPLVRKLRDEDWFVRHKAVLALGKMKAELSIHAVETLIHSTLDEHEYVVLAARHVLSKIQNDMSQEDPLYEEIAKTLDKPKSLPEDSQIE